MFDFASIFTTEASYLPYRLIGMVGVIAVLGGGITLMLRLLGDMGPTYDGRLTANPITHLDGGGFVAGMVLRPGWAASVKVRPDHVKGGAWGVLLAVLVPLAVLVGLAALLEMLRPVFFAMMGNGLQGTKMVLRSGYVAELFIWCALVNLIPLPPFLMGHLWAAWSPKLWQSYLHHAGWVSVACFVLVLSGAFKPVIGPIATAIQALLRI